MKLRLYLDFIKIEHTLFALPFAYVGALLAGYLDFKLAFLILLAFTGLRTAAMSLNRIIDREIDAKNPRTAKRHLPAGLISLNEAYAITFVALVVYFTSAVLINKTCALLSPIPPLIAYVYPYLKRYSCICHYFLGLNLALAPLGGFVAVTDSIDFLNKGYNVFLLSLGVLLWVAGFDIIYSLQDLEFDRKEGLHSLPAHFGERFATFVALANHLLFLALVYFALEYLIVAAFLAILISAEHYIVHFRREKLDYAFFHLNALISATIFGYVFFRYILASAL
ncbi:MAG: UbiA-like polyprenyltransferase [Archaeoglobaceae archaeon]